MPRRPASCMSWTKLSYAPPHASMPAEVVRWRKAERERLIAARLAVSADVRAAMTNASPKASTPRSATSPAN